MAEVAYIGNRADNLVVSRTEIIEVNDLEVSFLASRFARNAKVEDIARQCGSDKGRMARAMQDRRALRGMAPDLDCAVYVASVQSRRASKVGFTSDPLNRVASLQTGSHERINLTHLFWLPRKAAKGLEKFTLRIAGRMGIRLVGEWVRMGPDELAVVIATLASEGNLPLANSAMFRQNCKSALRSTDADMFSKGYARDPFAVLSNSGY